MKHNQRSASPGELACPHLSDHPTQEAKQQSNSDHGRNIVCSDRRPAAAFLTLNSSFCLFTVRPSFQEHTQNTVRHNGNTIKPQQNTINTVKTHSFFSGDPNVDSRSACSAYPFEKILDPIQPLAVSLQTSLPPAETKLRKIEKKLRFSVQTETFSLLPTTYVKKCENKKFLRLLDRKLACLSSGSRPPFGARTALSARHFRNTRNTPKTHARHPKHVPPFPG